MKPRYHLVPCPHCSSCQDKQREGPPQQVPLLRSFTTETSLQAQPNEGEGPPGRRKPYKHPSPGETRHRHSQELPSVQSSKPHPPGVPVTTSPPSNMSLLGKALRSPWQHLTHIGKNKPRSGIGTGSPVPDPGQLCREEGGNRYLKPEYNQRTVLDPYSYAFRYDDCVVMARSQEFMTCPAHGKILLRYMAPDTVGYCTLFTFCSLYCVLHLYRDALLSVPYVIYCS